jgi:hypothetical protein
VSNQSHPCKRRDWRELPTGDVASLVLILGILASPRTALGQDSSVAASPERVPVVPLVAASPSQKLLVIAPSTELHYLRTACQQLRLAADFVENFDARRRDYRPYHAVLVGTNRMDFFDKPETQVPEVFQPVVDFVAAGGHLLMFGTYHGRHMEHLHRFGIEAWSGGGSGFLRVPGASDALFAGSEELVPKDDSLTFLGRYRITRPHVVLLLRSDGDPAVATTPFRDGRVSIMMVEPGYQNDLWLYRVILAWHQRGAPSRLATTGMFDPADSAGGTARQDVPNEGDIARSVEAIQKELDADYRQLKPWNSALAKDLARKLLDRATGASEPTLAYALLTEARNLAVRSGDSATLLNATDVRSRQYRIDPLAELPEALSECSSACRMAGDCRTVAEVAMMAARDAIAAGQFDSADELLTIAAGNARRARVADLPRQIANLKQHAGDARKAAVK